MIESKIFHAIRCNRCQTYDDSEFVFCEDEDTAIDNAVEGDWLIDENRHFCPNCWIKSDKGGKVILPPYPDHLKNVMKFIRTLYASVRVVAEAKDHFDILISFYRHDEPKTLRKHEENYINNLALGKIIMIDNRHNTSLIRVAAE